MLEFLAQAALLGFLQGALVTLPPPEPGFNPMLWERCVDTMNADPERGTDSDMEECDRLYDPKGVMAEEEPNDGR